MVTIHQSTIQEYVRKGIVRARKIGKNVLVSRVKEIQDIDPLLFFAAGQKYFAGKRLYWTNPSNSNVFVGLGIAHSIEVTDDSMDRFNKVERKWKELINNAMLLQEGNTTYGTGPVIFGGFSFDPLKESTELWRKFPNSKFTLPTFMLSIIKGKTFLTTNILCNENGMEEIDDIEKLEITLLHDAISSKIDKQDGMSFDLHEIMPDQWMDTVENAARSIRDGEVEKVVLAREIRLQFNQSVEAANVLQNLHEEQPMSYRFAIECDNDCFIGASPERLIKKERNELLSTCLAGSIKRGTTIAKDDELGNQLLQDQKNLVEHQVVVQMIKEAMRQSCVSVSSPDGPTLYKMRDIQHLYTPVKGKAKSDVSLLSMVNSLHPTPALGGFPKRKAVERIREIEILDRGWYASPIGWLDSQDNGEFAVAIRSGLLQDNEASLFAGCGIVGDSKPESEYNETNIKFKPMLSALGGFKNENK